MLIALFVFEFILIGLTVFTTHMMEHKFASIQASLDMYCSKRAYKTKADIHFIEMMLEEYNSLCSDTDEEPDLPSAISLKLHKEFIGRFSYVSVMNMACKARYLMWGVFGAEVLIASINQVASEGSSLVIIFASLLLTIMMSFYGIIKGLYEKQETLIDEVTHYIKNLYPLEVKKQKRRLEQTSHQRKSNHANVTQIADVRKQRQLQDGLQNEETEQAELSVQKEDSINEPSTKVPCKSSELSAKDIAQLLSDL